MKKLISKVGIGLCFSNASNTGFVYQLKRRSALLLVNSKVLLDGKYQGLQWITNISFQPWAEIDETKVDEYWYNWALLSSTKLSPQVRYVMQKQLKDACNNSSTGHFRFYLQNPETKVPTTITSRQWYLQVATCSILLRNFTKGLWR